MLAKMPPTTAESKVSVSLAGLIDLAGASVRIRLHHPQFRARQSGAYVSRFKGRGMEFEETRIYQPGDDIRSIDWRVTARTGATHTKIFREEREKPVFISVDMRPTMQFATRGVFKSVLAAKLAGLLAWTAQQQGDRLGGQLFSGHQCRELKPQNGRQAVLRFLDMLVKGQSGQAIDAPNTATFTLDGVLARLAHHARPGSLVYVISDFRGFNATAEIHLAKLAEHCDVVLVFVFDALEKCLPTPKGHYRFTDMEREVIIDSSDRQRLLAYQQHFTDRLYRLEQFAKKRGLVFIKCSTTEDPLTCLR